MIKKLKQSLVPEGVNYEEWITNASVKDLVAEAQFRIDSDLRCAPDLSKAPRSTAAKTKRKNA